MSEIKRLFFDIEVEPCVGWFWRPGYNQVITPEQILQEAVIICISYKWENDKKASTLFWDDGDDVPLLRKFLELYEQADEVIYHNGKGFDMGWVRKQVAKYGIGPIPKRKDYDTLSLARSHFKFNSNKLDYIAQFLLGERKDSIGKDTWLGVMRGKRDACKKMAEYCEKDVLLLQRVWDALTKVTGDAQSHVGVLNNLPKWTCPWDGSTDVSLMKEKATSKGTLQYEMLCNECGRYYTISRKSFVEYMRNKYDLNVS